MDVTLITHSLTHSMEQSPSWKANQFSASEKTSCILWNQKVHCRVYKCPPPVPIPSQLDPGHASPSHFLKIMLILSSHLHLGLPTGFFPSGFPTKTLYAPHLSPHTCYIPGPSHSSWFDHPNNIWWGI